MNFARFGLVMSAVVDLRFTIVFSVVVVVVTVVRDVVVALFVMSGNERSALHVLRNDCSGVD